MEKVRLGRTNLKVTRTSFGALPIQRINMEQAVHLLRKAYEYGFNFFDTARGYSDSEEKIGHALSHVRENIIIATKSPAKKGEDLLHHVSISLANLKTNYIDILQLHNPGFLPQPGDGSGLYEALMEVKAKGQVKHLGITNHSLSIAMEAATSGLYDTIQFPLSYISSTQDLALIQVCQENDVGVIAMKALAGGLITNATAAFAFLRQYPHVVPIWGIQKESELDELVELDRHPPVFDDRLKEIIAQDINDLSGDFCRACGYCLPCPVKIPIPTAARMSLLLRRSPPHRFMAADWKSKMHLIKDCIQCGVCQSRCPYNLNTPLLLQKMLEDYDAFYTHYHSN